MEPFYPGFDFPISPRKLVGQMNVKYPGRKDSTVTVQFTSAVSEWTILNVPAGTFQVLTIYQYGINRVSVTRRPDN
jgi:hypothetical protein